MHGARHANPTGGRGPAFGISRFNDQFSSSIRSHCGKASQGGVYNGAGVQQFAAKFGNFTSVQANTTFTVIDSTVR